MRPSNLIFGVLLVAFGASAQSESYQVLKSKFGDQPQVESFSCGGWLARLVFKMADEPEVYQAVKDLNHLRIITIPKQEFESQHLSVKGFKKVLHQDSFQELAVVRDQGEEVSIYLREGKNKNRYFVLVDDEHEVTAIELSGYIDTSLLDPGKSTIYNR